MTSICIGESLNELVSTPLDGEGERDSVSESEYRELPSKTNVKE